MSATVLGVIGTLLSAVSLAAGAIITSRATGRKTHVEAKGLEARLPAEIDSVVVQGAEQAVLTMGKALESANLRCEQLEREKAQLIAHLTELETKVATLEGKVAEAETAASAARQAGDALRVELNSLISEQRNRH